MMITQPIITALRLKTVSVLLYCLTGCILGGAFSAATAFLLLTSCSSGVVRSSQDIIFPSSNVSYQNHVQPFFDVTCAFAGCHSSFNPAGGLSLASYLDVMRRPGLVISGRPDQSLLIQVVDTQLPSSALHPFSFQQRITQNHITGLRTWIREGARLN